MTDARDIDCPKCANSGDDCGEHSPSWEELVDYWKNEAASLRKQLEDAREALGFYGREANYRTTTMYMSGRSGQTAIDIDGGKRAREALNAALGPLPAPPSD